MENTINKKISSKIKNLVKTKKFWIRLGVYFCAGLIIFILASQLILRYFISGGYVKGEIEKLISAQINNGGVSIGSISANLKGIEVNAINISTESGSVLYADKLIVMPGFLPLLKGKIVIKDILVYGLALNAVKDENRLFNFEALLPKSSAEQAEEAEKESGSTLDIYINTIQLEDASITYKDKLSSAEIKLYDTFLDIKGFSLSQTFGISLDSDISFKNDKTVIAPVSLGFKAEASLASMDWDKAFCELKSFALRFNDSSVSLTAVLNGFKNPQGRFSFKANKLLSDSFADITKLPAFDLSLLQINAAFRADTQSSLITVDNFYFETVFSSASAKGYLNYAAKEPSYNFDINAYNNLENIPKAVFMAADFKPQGILTADLNLNNTSKAVGKITASDIGFFTDQAGTFSSVNTIVSLQDINDISVNSLSGVLNGYPFKAKGSYKMTPKEGFANLSFNAAKVWIKKTAQALEQTPDTPVVADKKPQGSLAKAEDNNFNLPPFHIKGNINIASLTAPFINASDIVFKADVNGVTYKLDRTQGSMSLTTAKGEIKDLYKLTNSNAVTKVLFMSVDIISRVINSLNVIAVLNSLIPDDAATTAQEQGEAAPDGKMAFDSLTTVIDFNKGFTEITQGSFVSSLASFKLRGNMDFNSRKLAMKVNAAPGRHYEDGIMPLTIYVDGTIDNPKGKMSIFSTTTSLVKQMLLNNFLSNAIKGGALSIVDSVSGEEIDAQTLQEEADEEQTAQEESGTGS